MSWFSDTKERASSVNGSIKVVRWMGHWNVSVKDCGQTSAYTNLMWEEALPRVALLNGGVTRVLMLGLGGGGSVPTIYKEFPQAEITAVEYDPEMVAIARELRYNGKNPFPKVVIGDAATVVDTIAGAYDLIIVDLFDGPEPSALSTNEQFVRALKALLTPGGMVLSNVYRRKEYLDTAASVFNRNTIWNFRDNYLGLFWQVPAEYVPPEAWPEFGYVATPRGFCRREEVGVSPKGIRWGLGPIIFEEYTSDTEPNLMQSNHGALARPRCIIWQPLTRRDTPKGWYRLSKLPWRTDAYHALADGYAERWHKSAQRKLRTWQTKSLGTKYEVAEVSFSEYAHAYRQSAIAKKYGLHLLEVLERKLALPTAQHVVLWGVRDKESGRIIAGTGALYSPTHQSSIREAPFILEEARHCHAMTGLMDHWFGESLKRGITLLVFTHFKQKGDPKDWSGFSDFKSHFMTGLVRNPPALYRFAGGKIF